MPFEDGPDPMGMDLWEDNQNWYLQVRNPCIVGTTTAPNWKTELESLLEDEAHLIRGTGTATSATLAFSNLVFDSSNTATDTSGTVYVPQIQVVNRVGVFVCPTGSLAVHVDAAFSPGATYKWRVQFASGVTPSNFHTLVAPVLGVPAMRQFAEDILPVKESFYCTVGRAP